MARDRPDVVGLAIGRRVLAAFAEMAGQPLERVRAVRARGGLRQSPTSPATNHW